MNQADLGLYGATAGRQDGARRDAKNLLSLIVAVATPEGKLDDDAIIVPRQREHRPGYVLMLYQDQKYEKGQEPWPKLEYIERD
jgi:hypothetical protein